MAFALAGTAVVLAGVAACSSARPRMVTSGSVLGSPTASATANAMNPADPTIPMNPMNTSSGPVAIHPDADVTGTAQRGTTVSFTADFARCMRANGVPAFPDPEAAKADWLAPGSGVDPASPQFLAALNGPCRTLAPAAWLSSGPVGAQS
ncbi:hypothetical protein [Catenulispora yoronensis]